MPVHSFDIGCITKTMTTFKLKKNTELFITEIEHKVTAETSLN